MTKTKEKLNGVFRRNWNGRYVYAAYQNGKLKNWVNVKGSKTNKRLLAAIFKKNKTFSRTEKREETQLTNVKEIIVTQKASLKNRNKKAIKRRFGKTAQYQISGTYNGSLIVARSQKLGSELAGNNKEMKRRAWESFLERLSQVSGGDYDADEGLKQMSKVKNLREGWVYYE